jgi:lipopolysaccharide transport system permease protein
MNNAMGSRKLYLIYIRDVLRVLVSRDFKLRYKRSLLGIGWSLLVPLAQLAVLYVVFSKLLRLNIPNYTSFLLAGILPWTWFQSSLLASSTTIVENRELVKQVGFPVGVLPTVTVLSQLTHFLLALPILAAFLLADGLRPGLSILALPIVVLVQFVLTVSIAYVVATLQVTFRDTHYLLGIFLFLFFYLTPVFWEGSGLPEPWLSLLHMNPVGSLLAAYRAILMRGEWPEAGPLTTLAVLSTIVLWLGYTVFLRARDRFVEEL